MYRIIGADGKEYGPVSLEQLKDWVAAGRVNGQTQVKPEGSADWKRASELPEMAGFLPPPPAPAGARAGAPSVITPVPAQARKTNPLAITSFVLGLVSLVLCLLALTGIPAVIFGHIARRQMRRSPVPQGGAGLAMTGLILGYLSLAFTLVLPAMLLPALAKAKQRAQSVQCSNHMKQIGLAFHMWATDNQDMFPFQVSTESGGTEQLRKTDDEGFDANTPEHLKILGPYLQNSRVLVCPADNTKRAAPGFDALQAGNVSYRLRTGPAVALTNATETLAI